MRRPLWLLVALLALPLLGSDSPKEYDGAAEMCELEGEWEIVSVESDPVPLPSSGLMVFRDGKWRYSREDELVGTGAYTTDSNRKPCHLDLTFTEGGRKGQTWKYLYRHDGDRLRIAERDGGRSRPGSFDEQQLYILNLRRVK
jgi:uncharacterized protein (TIGR03067 family)